MHVLFVHQNCPAQFLHVAPGLVKRGHQCTFVTTNEKASPGAGVRKVLYRPVGASPPRWPGDSMTRSVRDETAHAWGVYEAMKASPDVRPDLVVAHSGFGSSLFLPHLYDAPVINFFEYYFRPGDAGQHLGYRPDQPVTEAGLLQTRMRNACFLLDLDNCDRGWCPNRAQRDTLPAEYHHKVDVIPEGIDTDFWKPLEAGGRGGGDRTLPDGTVVPAGTRLVTYVARGLERMRGFDVFMEVAKRVYSRFPDVLFVVVGEDKCYYNSDWRVTGGRTLREHLLAQGDHDPSKFKFTGRVPADHLASILAHSDLHIYLTEPFVTSWSLLDAMSSGCVVLASDQTCVKEYVRDGENGLLADFFDVAALAEKALKVLDDPPAHRPLGNAARRTILDEGYALRDTLPRIEKFFQRVAAAAPRRPSMRAELIVRKGAAKAAAAPTAPSPFARAGLAEQWREARADAAAAARAEATVEAEGAEVSAMTTTTTATTTAGVMTGVEKRKTILFCWELGAGLGHVMELAPLVNAMCERGHKVYAAMRELRAASAAFDPRARLVQAPYLCQAEAPPAVRRPTRNFADILGNLTFGDDHTLLSQVEAWRGLIELVRPDVIVFDYSPTALLAARAAAPDAKRIVVGNGFLIPPDVSPFPALRYWAPMTPDEREGMRRDEEAILDRANHFLHHCGPAGARMDRLGRLFGDVDLTLMMTLKEMDPYAAHRPPGTEYLGAVNATGGLAPRWPAGDGPRVYAYLQPVPAMGDLLAYLGERGVPSVVFAPKLTDAGRRRFAHYKTLRLESERLDLARVGRECDVAVLNGNLGTSTAMLLAGRPALHLPEHLEHALNARSVAALGAGLVAPAKGPGAAVGKLAALIGGGGGRDHAGAAATSVASRYGPGLDAARQAGRMVERLQDTLRAAA